MLKNELQDIKDLLFYSEPSASNPVTEIRLESQFKHISKAWETVMFSETPEHSLMRYFHYHLEGISNLSNTLYISPGFEHYRFAQSQLLSLLDHLKKQYAAYFNLDAYAPVAYHQKLLCQLEASKALVYEKLEAARLSPALKACLLQWLDEMSETGYEISYSFRSLHYLEYMVRLIPRIDFQDEMAENKLVDMLCQSNFNHLTFLVYRQGTIRNVLADFTSSEEQLNYLQDQRATVLSCPEERNSGYDTSWPSLKTMLSDWLQEEINLAKLALCRENEARAEQNIPKLPIAISVAQMACLIRLLFEESVFATQNLKFIFKCFAGHYQTKRQSVISSGSLSKEFYSIDQHTAARVRDLLQKMIQRINRNFFPVLVAIGITILLNPGR